MYALRVRGKAQRKLLDIEQIIFRLIKVEGVKNTVIKRGGDSMTTRTIKTTDDEANKILQNKVRFIFRSDREYFKENDIIQFRVIKNLHDVIHKIDTKKYVVTAVMDCMNAPVTEGFQFIAFREV